MKVIDARAEIRQNFSATKPLKLPAVLNDLRQATHGAARRGRVCRGRKFVADSTVASLKRFKDDVKEVAAGFECGISVQDFNDPKVGEFLEFYRMEKQKPSISRQPLVVKKKTATITKTNILCHHITSNALTHLYSREASKLIQNVLRDPRLGRIDFHHGGKRFTGHAVR